MWEDNLKVRFYVYKRPDHAVLWLLLMIEAKRVSNNLFKDVNIVLADTSVGVFIE
jgi:hypothetical protein